LNVIEGKIETKTLSPYNQLLKQNPSGTSLLQKIPLYLIQPGELAKH